MPDFFVQSFRGDTPVKDFTQIDLKGADSKPQQADDHKKGAGEAHRFQESSRRQNHVGQKKHGGPTGGGVLPKKIEYGAKNRVEEEGEGTDDDHFQGHDEENRDATEGGNSFGQRGLRLHLVLLSPGILRERTNALTFNK